MRSGRSNHTYVKARELETGMVVTVPSINGRDHVRRKIVSVRRAADIVAEKQVEVAKAKSRPKLRAAVDDLYDALNAIDNDGREARMVLFEGNTRAVSYMSQDELRYVGQERTTT